MYQGLRPGKDVLETRRILLGKDQSAGCSGPKLLEACLPLGPCSYEGYMHRGPELPICYHIALRDLKNFRRKELMSSSPRTCQKPRSNEMGVLFGFEHIWIQCMLLHLIIFSRCKLMRDKCHTRNTGKTTTKHGNPVDAFIICHQAACHQASLPTLYRFKKLTTTFSHSAASQPLD